MNVATLRKRVWETLEPAREDDNLSRKIDIFLLILITLNVFAVILETVDTLYVKHQKIFTYFEMFSVTVFIIEYLLRFWSCIENENKSIGRLNQRLKYAFSFSAIIDLMAILPSIIALIYPTVDLRFIRALRILRLLKFSRYSSSINSLLLVLWDQRKSFGAAFFILFIALIIASSGMYLVEKDVQPDKFGSIPDAMWWAIVTLTTVGYGDVTPITSVGRIFGSIIIILGIGTVALPSGILAAAFSDFTKRNQRKYEDRLKNMLDDDVIDEEERKELKRLSEKLNLSEEDILSIEQLNKINQPTDPTK
tara:strand:- start:892 stop:1815 length:924 start_codon:yes stop_codon:yes gene_type:complete